MSMISPEVYFDMFIKDKSQEEIETNLQKLRQEAAELSLKVSNNEECFFKPDFKTQLAMTHKYYDYAMTKLYGPQYNSLYYCWTNCGQMHFLRDVAKIEIFAWAGSGIKIRTSNAEGSTIDFKYELIEEIFGTINSKHILLQLQNIDFPEQKEYDNGGCDGSAWNLRVNDMEYKGYIVRPPFIEKIEKILHFDEVFSKSKDQIILTNLDSQKLKEAYDFFKPKDSNTDIVDNGKLDLVATMKDKLQANAAWCASFSLAWRIFQEKYLKNDFDIINKNTLIENLVESYSKNIFVNENDCYINSGKATEKFKKEIEKAIKKKFKTKSDVLKNLPLSKDENTLDFLIYAIIMFNLKFPKAFEPARKKLPFGDINGPRVNFFGVMEDSKTKDLFKQVQPLFYENDKEFAVSLSSKDNKQIILYRTDSCENFEDTFNKVNKKLKENTNIVEVKSFLMPELYIDLTKNYEDLYHSCYISKKDNKTYKITKAIQTLQLDLNNKGAKVKSEAAIMGKETAVYRPPVETNKKDFLFRDTFYLFIVEKANPIVALRINDIKEFI